MHSLLHETHFKRIYARKIMKNTKNCQLKGSFTIVNIYLLVQRVLI